MWTCILVLVFSTLVGTDDTKNIHSPCRILLNEFSPTKECFVEVGKFCAPGKDNEQTSLAGYHILVVDSSDLKLVHRNSIEKIKIIKHEVGKVKDIGGTKAVTSNNKGGKGSVSSTSTASDQSKQASPTQTGIANQANQATRNAAKGTVPTPVSGSSSQGSKQPTQAVSSSNNGLKHQASKTANSEMTGATGAQHVITPKPVPLNPSATLAGQINMRTDSQDSQSVVTDKRTLPSFPTKASGSIPHAAGTKDAPVNTMGASSDRTQKQSRELPAKGPQINASPNAPSSLDHDTTGAQKNPPSATVQSSGQTKGDLDGLKSANVAHGAGLHGSLTLKPSTTMDKESAAICSNCPTPAKKPKRVKRYAQQQQQNIWGVAHVFLELNLDPAKTYAVVLLYLPYCKRNRMWDKYAEGVPLKEEALQEISSYAQDFLVIGSDTEDMDLSNLFQLIPLGYDVPTLSLNEPITDYSFSKCDAAITPFNVEGFLLSERTPGSPNTCPVPETLSPFSFRGKVLRAQSQELIVNVVANLRQKINDEAWRSLKAEDAAAEILNLSKKSINRIMTRYEDGDPFTNGKKRCRTRPTTDLDFNQREILYDCIVEPYRENKVPRFARIWKCFVERVRRYQLEELETEMATLSTLSQPSKASSSGTEALDDGISLEDDQPASNKLYHCSAWSFSKILDKYGYNYGKIRNRDAQIFKPSIIKWRAKYIEAIKKYENDPEWNVVYQDETWIDPHQRADRGWVRRKYDNFAQRMEFTFRDDKISRGNRLIVLAAGGKDGFIHEATEVFAVPVKRKNSCKTTDSECPGELTEDYHDNVKGPKFQKWLEGLFKLLQNKKTVFVMDNCPFHKVLGIPKKSDLKDSVRKWLEDKKNEGFSITEDVSPSTKLTKPQLLAIVDRLTDESSGDERIPRTQVQQLAHRYGHRILHIPPYNCDLNPIEYVWNDIKREVKEENTEQTVKHALQLAKRKLSVYPAEEWRKKISHVRKREDKYLEGDKVFTDVEDEENAEPLNGDDFVNLDKEGGLEDPCGADE